MTDQINLGSGSNQEWGHKNIIVGTIENVGQINRDFRTTLADMNNSHLIKESFDKNTHQSPMQAQKKSTQVKQAKKSTSKQISPIIKSKAISKSSKRNETRSGGRNDQSASSALKKMPKTHPSSRKSERKKKKTKKVKKVKQSAEKSNKKKDEIYHFYNTTFAKSKQRIDPISKQQWEELTKVRNDYLQLPELQPVIKMPDPNANVSSDAPESAVKIPKVELIESKTLEDKKVSEEQQAINVMIRESDKKQKEGSNLLGLPNIAEGLIKKNPGVNLFGHQPIDRSSSQGNQENARVLENSLI